MMVAMRAWMTAERTANASAVQKAAMRENFEVAKTVATKGAQRAVPKGPWTVAPMVVRWAHKKVGGWDDRWVDTSAATKVRTRAEMLVAWKVEQRVDQTVAEKDVGAAERMAEKKDETVAMLAASRDARKVAWKVVRKDTKTEENMVGWWAAKMAGRWVCSMVEHSASPMDGTLGAK